MKALIAACSIALCAAPAFAWDEATDFRGLHFYTASSDSIALTAVCDPGGAFIPPTNHLQIEIHGQPLEGPYTLKSGADTFTGTMIAGAAISREDAEWKDIVAVLRSGSELELTSADQTYQLDTEAPLPVTCGAEV
ncbi:hypothetical protein E4L95_01755 [Paracoccus liaowanqingii]|uniref:Excinuclease ABC subunit B n=1 Tax=Paracoccus liaowanqingii TaxID=2560053 RepID=A0A4Z1CSC1_9RHOB|nr:hypothetical protein [Paracoccus liaowanqingii]TGN68328.1 hypothetical protein E4L95_01755 [Paracoccus liaowanqingii]